MRASAERKALLEELERSREQAAANVGDLRDSLNFPQRLKGSIQRRPAWWVGGGVAAGFVLSSLLIPRRRKKREDGGAPVRQSLFLGLLGIAGKQILRQATPALKSAAREKLADWFSGLTASPPAPSENGPDETSAESNATSSDPHV